MLSLDCSTLYSQTRTLAKQISFIENNPLQAAELLKNIDFQSKAPVLGVTGAPGSGKSTLVNALVSLLIKQQYKIAILAVDPSSPFNFGSILGDRMRMQELYMQPNVFIRSISSRGSLGGLNSSMLLISDFVSCCGFDYVFIETVGVGQSEVEIAALADCTVVVTVPEGGDDIQAMKSGVMEIADVFAVNKADRPNSQQMIAYLTEMANSRFHVPTPVIPIQAAYNIGINELFQSILSHLNTHKQTKTDILAAKAFQLISAQRMSNLSYKQLHHLIQQQQNNKDFNLYLWISQFYT